MKTARVVAWSGFAVCGLIVAITGPLVWVNEGNLGRLSIPIAMLATAGIGALLASRRPDNVIGWLLCASGLASAGTEFAQQYAAASVRTALPAAGAIFMLVHVWGISVVSLALATILFPDGHLPSPRWRPVVWLALLDIAVLFVGPRSVAGPLSAELPLTRWLGTDAGEGVFVVARTSGGLLLALLLVCSVVALRTRLGRAAGVERQQLKWVALGFAFLTVIFLVTTNLVLSPFGQRAFGSEPPANALPIPFAVAFAAVPISIGVAILRYRLYDIDVLINRSLVYGALSVALAGAYFASVLALETLLRPLTAGSEVAVALSTLAVVALFTPLRRRIQGAVDLRFFRARYDATRTLDAFGLRLRDEVDLEAVRASLLGAVDETVHPVQAEVWLRRRVL